MPYASRLQHVPAVAVHGTTLFQFRYCTPNAGHASSLHGDRLKGRSMRLCSRSGPPHRPPTSLSPARRVIQIPFPMVSRNRAHFSRASTVPASTRSSVPARQIKVHTRQWRLCVDSAFYSLVEAESRIYVRRECSMSCAADECAARSARNEMLAGVADADGEGAPAPMRAREGSKQSDPF